MEDLEEKSTRIDDQIHSKSIVFWLKLNKKSYYLLYAWPHETQNLALRSGLSRPHWEQNCTGSPGYGGGGISSGGGTLGVGRGVTGCGYNLAFAFGVTGCGYNNAFALGVTGCRYNIAFALGITGCGYNPAFAFRVTGCRYNIAFALGVTGCGNNPSFGFRTIASWILSIIIWNKEKTN